MAWREEAFERSPVASLVYGPDGTPIAANAAYRELFGLDDGLDAGLRERIHPDDREAARAAGERLRSGAERIGPHEVRVRAGDGSWRTVLVSTMGLPGHPEIIVSLADVTVQREAEAARDREARYTQALLDRSADIITVLEADGTWRSSSAQGTRILGYPRGYEPDGGIWALLHPDDRDLAATALAAVIEGRQDAGVPVELRLATIDGDYRRFDVAGVNLLDDPVVSGVVVTARDVTERHEAREALAASETRYRQLVAHMQEGLWVVGADGITAFVNPRMAEMLGTTPEEMVGAPLLDWVPVEHHRESEARLDARRRGVTETYERVFLHRDGSLVPTLVSATPLLANGRMVEAFATVTDISRLKAAEAELDAALRRAQEADRAKSVFLSHVSHELRTPLNAVLGYAGLLRQSAADPTVLEYTAEIEFAGRHLLHLIEDLLDVTRLETGPIALRPEPVPVADAVAEAATLAGIPDDRLRMTDLGHTVSADPTRLRQVLVNLLANARVHGPADGAITVAADRTDDRVRISVADEGPGIPPDDAARVFEPFVQLDSGRTTTPTGTGLGLPISRSLTEAMAGTLVYEAGPPSRFVVELPAGPSTVAPRSTTPHILAVEDDPAGQRLLAAILRRAPGCTHQIAGTLAEARRLIDTTAPAILVLDVHLPDGNGLDLLRALRGRSDTARLPVAVITADGSPELRHEALDAGATAFLTKPYDVGALLDTIESLAPAQGR
jgi:PAS domain S-box-containing protein